MNDDKEAGSQETPAKSPTTTDEQPNFQQRFTAELEKWREAGCPVSVNQEGEAHKACGSRPHRTRILPKDGSGFVVMSVDCVEGHEGVWKFEVAEAEMQAELKRQAEVAADAEANAGKKAFDPMVAKVSISLNLKTQELKIEPFVPTPGMGIQLAGMLMSHFFAQLQDMAAAQGATPGPKLKLAPKGIIHPKTGRLVS